MTIYLDGGATIQTFTGGQFHLLEPRAEEIYIEDIAHALSMQCRFTGHTRFHYSVAQHSYLASLMVPAQFQLEALLHDAAEAYICDMSRPLKHFSEMGKYYLEIEERINKVIREKFCLPSKMSPQVKEADNALLYVEKDALLPKMEWTHDWGKSAEHTNITIIKWPPRTAESIFLHQFNLLNVHSFY